MQEMRSPDTDSREHRSLHFFQDMKTGNTLRDDIHVAVLFLSRCGPIFVSLKVTVLLVSYRWSSQWAIMVRRYIDTYDEPMCRIAGIRSFILHLCIVNSHQHCPGCLESRSTGPVIDSTSLPIDSTSSILKAHEALPSTSTTPRQFVFFHHGIHPLLPLK